MAYQTEERIERELRSQIANLEFQFIEVEKLLCGVLGREWRPSGFSISTLVAEIKERLEAVKQDGLERSLLP